VRWIGSFQLFFAFAPSLPAGRFADAGYFHTLVLSGTVLFSTCLYLLSLVGDEQYGLVFLLQAVGMGTGVGLVFVPSSTVSLHYFSRWKGLVLGIVMSGGAFGGMIFPPIIRWLIPQRGLGGAPRITAYIVLGSLLVANCLLTIPDKSDREKHPLPRLDLLNYSSEMGYVYAAVGTCLTMLVVSFPDLYLEVLGLERGVDPVTSFNSGVVLSFTGGIGGILLGFISDKYGIWNIMIPVSGGLALTLFTMCAVQGPKSLIAHSIFYGFFSGAWFSLMVTALGSLAASMGEMSTRVGLVLTGSSIFCLLSFSLQDALLGTTFNWAAPSIFSGFLLLGVTGLVYLSRTKFAAAKHVQKKFIKGIQIL
jgi:MFS family permease